MSNSISGIGSYRISCARGKSIFALLPTKTAEFEVKNRRKSAEEAKAERLLFCYYCIFFEVNYRRTIGEFLDCTLE